MSGGTESGDSSSKSRGGKGVSAPPFTAAGIVSARGTGDGLVIRLDARAEEPELMDALRDFVSSRRSFLEGNTVAIEWIGGEASPEVARTVREELGGDFNVSVSQPEGAKENRSAKVMNLSERLEVAKEEKSSREASSSLGLFGGMHGLDLDNDMDSDDVSQVVTGPKEGAVFDSAAWDDPDARLVYKTLRSGQKVETEHSLIIVGDVNSGAELVAGGDIIVLGSLRGVAHAGAYDETGGGRFIFALDLQPTQLRIGSIISRGSGDGKGARAEIARVDGNLIVVEPYGSRSVLSRRK